MVDAFYWGGGGYISFPLLYIVKHCNMRTICIENNMKSEKDYHCQRTTEMTLQLRDDPGSFGLDPCTAFQKYRWSI